MPVYIRTGELDIPAPSISSLDSEDEATTFNLDPDLVVDELPQPYRMIDKVLSQVVDDSWEVIVAREVKKAIEATMEQPPVYKATSAVSEIVKAGCMSHSKDDRYIFVAFQSGELVAYDAVSYNRLATWTTDERDTCIELMTSEVIGPDIHLLATIDDMGFARLMIFVDSAFCLVQLLNEQIEGSPKSNAIKFNLSKNGDYCGISMESEGTSWLEIHKTPRDNWLREIEIAQKELMKRNQMSAESLTIDENSVEAEEPVVADTLDIKLSPITLALKVKSPVPLVGSTALTQQEAMEKAGLPHTFGNGTNHLFTDNHLRIRRAVTQKIHEELLQNYDEDFSNDSVPTWHFLNSSKMQPETIVHHHASDTGPVSLNVWWSNSYLVQIYPLHAKNAKDLELKPDFVWPMCGQVTSSAVSECTNILAFGLKNGYIYAIDRHLVIPRVMLHLGQSAAVKDLFILDSSVANLTCEGTSPPPMYCLAGLENGCVLLVHASSHSYRILTHVSEKKEDRYSMIKPLLNAPQLFFWIANTGTAKIIETVTGSVICELVIPESIEEAKSRLCFSANDDILYIKNNEEALESFWLKNFSSLDEYFEGVPYKQPLIVKESIEERCQKLLTRRTQSQAKRNNELASNWVSMHKELSVLLTLKPSMSSTSLRTDATSPISRWNETVSKIVAHTRGLSR